MPGDVALTLLLLGWPFLLTAAVAGIVIGWLLGRLWRPWLGVVVGVVAGVWIGGFAFIAYAGGWFGG